jgi:hypothetical protein
MLRMILAVPSVRPGAPGSLSPTATSESTGGRFVPGARFTADELTIPGCEGVAKRERLR